MWARRKPRRDAIRPMIRPWIAHQSRGVGFSHCDYVCELQNNGSPTVCNSRGLGWQHVGGDLGRIDERAEEPVEGLNREVAYLKCSTSRPLVPH